jgi:alpha-L-glutamate ligase-like protein
MQQLYSLIHALKLHRLLLLSALMLVLLQQNQWPLTLNDFAAQRIHTINLNTWFRETDQATTIRTYIPDNDPWQTLLSENLSTSGVSSSEQFLPSGRLLSWTPEDDQSHAGYQIRVHIKGVRHNIGRGVSIANDYPQEFTPYLTPSEHVQSEHPELLMLWQTLQPDVSSAESVLRAIYTHTYENIEGAPFKGTTDALTASRLGIASCNGKSRLFVALARINNIPARLVGGLILDDSSKKTSHQWVEAYVAGEWLTFDPTNGYFAERPGHYLKLYEGDHALFRHTKHIGFDYLFDLSSSFKSPVLNPELMDSASAPMWLANTLPTLNLSENTLAIIMLFPLCALIITFLRNVIGVKTFGIFMPVLIASTFLYTGLLMGIIGLTLILTLAWAAHHWLEKQRILKTARLAIVVSLVSILFVALLWQSALQQQLTIGMLALMPVVIISFMAERIHQVSQNQDLKELLVTTTGTLFTIATCYLYLNSHLLLSLFILFPQLYLAILASLMMIGRWEGIRTSELLRFKQLPKQEKQQLLGINQRNRGLVYKHNSKRDLRLAADKLESKKALQALNIPVPETLLRIDQLNELANLKDALHGLSEFVIKPNQGSQGNGILVIHQVTEQHFITASGRKLSLADLKNHIKEILLGHYSQSGGQDTAYIEPLIIQHPALNCLFAKGLADLRIIVAGGKCQTAMLRLPTSHSDGKANLHQGAIGIAIDISNGITQRAQLHGQEIQRHPDTQQPLLNIALPYWSQILDMAAACYDAIPLGYLGVDICLDHKAGPLVLEVNGRAGLEIQNVQRQGMASVFSNAMGDA